jgi:iron complex transport system substrate-binding protein
MISKPVFAFLLMLSFGLSGCEGGVEESAETTPKAAEAKVEAKSEAKTDGETERLVTLGGTISEITFALGHGDKVVGVDASTLYPPEATKLPKVGYYRKVDAESILSLKPTRVLARKGTGPASALEQIKSAGVEVVLFGDAMTGEEAIDRIGKVAEVLGSQEKGKGLVAKLEADLVKAQKQQESMTARPSVLFIYARGVKTLMVAGTETPADAMITLAGGKNTVAGFTGFKPLTPEAVVQAQPDLVLLPTKGYESLKGGLWDIPGLAQTNAGKNKAVVTIDDLKLLGFGPRMGEALLELNAKLQKKK